MSRIDGSPAPFPASQIPRAIPKPYFPRFSSADPASTPVFTCRIFSDRPVPAASGADHGDICFAGPILTNFAAQKAVGDKKLVTGTYDHEVKVGEPASIKNELMDKTSAHIISHGSSASSTRQRKSKSTKQKKHAQHTPEMPDGLPSDALGPSSSGRYDSSLGLLTKKFTDLLDQAKDGSVDLNEAANILGVQKRRIYDITNVLEGVGLMEKTLKNRVQWKGTGLSKPRELENQVSAMKTVISKLRTEEDRIDEMIRQMQENLTLFTEDENIQKWLYITKGNITSLPPFKDATLFAIKAPRWTSVEVLNPDESVEFPHRQYQIYFRSSMGQIDCYLLSDHEERSEASTQACEPEHTANDRDGSQALVQGQCVAIPSSASNLNLFSQESRGGFVRIAPSDPGADADYWFLSDSRVSISDLWRTDFSNAEFFRSGFAASPTELQLECFWHFNHLTC